MNSLILGYFIPHCHWIYHTTITNISLFSISLQLPSGVDLTLSELQDMASRQQRQIDEQQQMLVAKEQRLKFLKQQEVRHQQIANENERLRKLREKVESQELKLKKLRALRGHVNEQKGGNNSLSKWGFRFRFRNINFAELRSYFIVWIACYTGLLTLYLNSTLIHILITNKNVSKSDHTLYSYIEARVSPYILATVIFTSLC